MPLFLPAALLLPTLGSFPYPSPEAQFSDLVISHYPNAIFLRQAILQWHSLPLWSPSILSGYPFAANPLSGIWYPPGWLALALPLPLGFNLLALLHILWGALGLYALLRCEGLSQPAAVLGGAAFASLPKLFAHYGAGHLTLLYAVPWTPWLLLAETWQPLEQNPRRSRKVRNVFRPALVLALIFLADVRWSAYAGLLWAVYSLFRYKSRKQIAGKSGADNAAIDRFTRWLAYLVRQAGLAALLAAPLGLPLLEYTRLSTRAHLQPQDMLAYSLPPSRLLGLIYPDFGGFHEWVLYPGAVVLLLSLLAVVWRRRLPQVRFWLLVAGVAILFSLGSNLPGIALLARLPGAGLLRVPPRALFLAGLALAVMAAHSMEVLLKMELSAFRRAASWVLLGVPAFAIAFSAAIWLALGRVTLPFLWGAVALLVAAVWVSLRMAGRVDPPMWAAGLLVLCLIDLGVMDRSLFSARPAAQVFTEGQSLALRLAAVPDRYRVYSPSYSLPQQTAARYGLELADGVDPLQLQAYVDFMQSASGVPVNGYSVTLPPLDGNEGLESGTATGTDVAVNGMGDVDISTRNAAYRPDPERLGLLNIAFIASDFELPVEGLELIAREGPAYVYENRLAKPRAWIQPAVAAAQMDITPAEITYWSPNRVEVSIAAGSGQPARRLVLAELAYPGWKAWIDGRPVDIETFEGVLRSVRVLPGSHQVVFRFRPLSVYSGLTAGFLGMAMLWLTGWSQAGPGRRSRVEQS